MDLEDNAIGEEAAAAVVASAKKVEVPLPRSCQIRCKIRAEIRAEIRALLFGWGPSNF